MSTFLDYLTSDPGFVDLKPSSFDVGGQFVRKLASYKESAVNGFLRNNIDMNQTIAKIAQDDNLNDNQIHRVIEEANTQVYLVKHAQCQNNYDREVYFPLADLQKVKDFMNNKQATAASLDSKLEKKASYENSDGDEALNAFNASFYDTTSLALDQEITAEEVVARELFKKHGELKADLSNKIAAFNASVYEFADVMLSLDRHFADTQSIFKHACIKGDLKIDKQQAVKLAISEKVAMLKSNNELFDSYELRLENIDTSIPVKDFSLKGRGFYKNASEDMVGKMPVILTESSRRVRNLEDLVKMAGCINETFNAAEIARRDFETIDSKLQR